MNDNIRNMSEDEYLEMLAEEYEEMKKNISCEELNEIW